MYLPDQRKLIFNWQWCRQGGFLRQTQRYVETIILRQRNPSNYIADIGVEGVHGSRYAHCVSGDGTMSTFNLRKNKLYVTSENELDCDYTSICCLDDCSKVIVGSLEGELLTFNYKEYGCSSDRIPGHTGTVDSIIEYNGGPHGSNIVLTAGEDGAIRALNIKPNRYLGIVGQQGNEESILRLCLFGNDHQNELVSLGEDGTVKFWNLDVLDQLEDINSTEKVLGKLKGTASLVGSEKQHFLSKIDKDEIDLPENVESDASSEWEDVIHESTSEEEDS